MRALKYCSRGTLDEAEGRSAQAQALAEFPPDHQIRRPKRSNFGCGCHTRASVKLLCFYWLSRHIVTPHHSLELWTHLSTDSPLLRTRILIYCDQ